MEQSGLGVIRLSAPIIALIAAFTSSGCTQTTQTAQASQPGMGDKTVAGLALGSVAGGIIGSQIPGAGLAGGIVGAAVGGAAGAMVGAALDEQDRQEMARLTRQSIESGQAQEYTSPRTGARVTVKVVKTTKVAQKLCRTASQDIELKDGTKSSETVTACRGEKGWVI